MTDSAHIVARESLAIAPLAQNVRLARRTVVETLESADRHDLADIAALATSEIVTNAVLHAGSDIWLTITVTARGALIEVEDHSKRVPQMRRYDPTATTGRGMSLVDKLVTAFGVRQIPGNGKVVWFTLGDAVPPQDAGSFQDERRSIVVALQQVPVALFCTFQQVADGLLREYLLALGAGSASPVDRTEWNLASEAFGELAAGGAAAFAQRDSGVTNLDLLLELGPRPAQRFSALRRVLDRAVAMAAAGRLLAPPSQPEIVGLRNWCCEQVALQLRGNDGTPWLPGLNAPVPQSTPVEWDASAVNASELAIVAADDANRIIAVSHAAEDLLGWKRGELIGQRIVTIVPESMREAHIAGFVRHLVSGEHRIIGTPVQVLALRGDGTELPVVLRVDIAARAGLRRVFTATFTLPD